jgi:hypothetical protein
MALLVSHSTKFEKDNTISEIKFLKIGLINLKSSKDFDLDPEIWDYKI